MATKSLLINFSGYPNEPYHFMPDNGLANLAASLMEKGNKTTIWDCSTVDMVKDYFPQQYKDDLAKMITEIVTNLKANTPVNPERIDEYRELNSKIEEYQKQKMQEIAEEISSYIRRNSFDFIGLKLWTGEGFEGSMVIAHQIRKDNPGIPIFAGGPHNDWFMERTFKVTSAFDVLAYGEGEEIINLLSDYVEGKLKLNDIPNIIFKKKERIITTPVKRVDDLNKLPLPVYDEDIYLSMKGDKKLKIILIDESRGCPNSCNFCMHPYKSGRKRRVVDSKAIVDKIETIIEKYGINKFRFAGSNPPARLTLDIAREIIRRKIKVIYTAFAHVREFTRDDFKLLKESGCYALSFGIESGSQKILDESMNKRVKVKQAKEVLNMCKKAGIKTIISIIMPAPLETGKTKQETMDFILEVKPDSTLVFFPSMLINTEWEKNREKYSFEVENDDELFETAMTYKMNHLMPSLIWKPIPGYRVNNKSFRELVDETSIFVQDLKKQKLITQLLDQTLVVAELLGEEPESFAKTFYNHIRGGNHVEISKIVSRVNNNTLQD